MGDAATQFYKTLATVVNVKHGLSYGVVMGWVRCKLSLDLSAMMCIWGVQSSLHLPAAEVLIAVQEVFSYFYQVWITKV